MRVRPAGLEEIEEGENKVTIQMGEEVSRKVVAL